MVTSERELIAPYAAWMLLMLVLPPAPWAYALRTAVTLTLLGWWAMRCRATARVSSPLFPALLSGVAAGLLVLAIWIFPDSFSWYRRFCVVGDPYAAAHPLALTSPLTWVQLFGSAFVISVAEELFFRKWLISIAGFWWSVGLFAVEHNRPLVAAVCGVIYGLVYLRFGLVAAIVAHVVTNLLLGLYVIRFGAWQFW